MKHLTMTKEQWIELFHAIDLDEHLMKKWHQVFEARYPAQHQALLEWLQIPTEEIHTIREQSKTA